MDDLESANRSTHREEAYQSAQRRQLLERLRFAIPLVMAVIVLDGLAQWVLGSPLFEDLMSVRIGALVALGILLVLSKARAADRYAYLLSLGGLLVMAVDIEAAILASGTYASRFQTGLALLPVAIALLLPYSALEMTGVVGVVWIAYLAPLMGSPKGSPLEFTIDAFFLAVASGLSIATSWMTARLRRRDFESRLDLEEEQRRSDALLRNVLPDAIAERLKREGRSIADRYTEVSVMFADIAGFTPLSDGMPPERLVRLLNEIVSTFDDLAEACGAEKIKTIGDAYMVVAGLPERNDDHAEVIATLALDMIDAFDRFASKNDLGVRLRIGIHLGPVVAGVIGHRKFAYDLWGDTVNTASRMESHGMPGRIHVTDAVREQLDGAFAFESRGRIHVKGKGDMSTWFLTGPR